jgi:hypothetical protein
MKQADAETAMGRIHYREAGAGPALLLLPGAGQTGEIFEALMPHLPDYRLIAPDTLGSGGSAPLPQGRALHETQAASFMAFLAESMVALLDALGIHQAHVYGIHTGNKIGAAMAANWPARVGRFVFVGQSHSIIADNAARNAAILKVAGHHLAPADPTAVLYRGNLAYDLDGDLRRLPARTLVIEIATPEEDAVIGRQGPGVAALMRDATMATFIEVDGLGHTLEGQARELAATLRTFLAAA